METLAIVCVLFSITVALIGVIAELQRIRKALEEHNKHNRKI